MIASKWFGNLIITVILVNSVLLGFTDYSQIERNPNSPYFGSPITDGSPTNTIVFKANNIFTYIFTAEMVLKIIAMGFFFGEGQMYLKDGWNILDFVVVVTSLIALLPSVPSVSIFRAFRVIRPLRNVSQLPGLRKLIKGFLKALPQLANVIFLLFFVFLVFSILGLTLFMGSLDSVCRLTPYPVKTSWAPGMNFSEYRCLDAPNVDLRSIEFPTQASSPWYKPQDCYWPTDDQDQRPCTFPGQAGNHLCFESESYPTWCGSNWDAHGNPRFRGETTVGTYGGYYFTGQKLMAWGTFNSNLDYGYTTFDNIFCAFVTVFESVTLEGWSWIMYLHRDTNNPVLVAVFFILFAMIGAHVGLNLLLAVLQDNFSLSKINSSRVNDSATALRSSRYSLVAAGPTVTAETKHLSPLYTLVSNLWFNRFVILVVLMNTIILSLDHYPSTVAFDNNCEKANFTCTLLFVGDMILKLAALGIRDYVYDSFNLFDGFVVLMSLIELCVSPPAFISGQRSQSKGLSAFRILRLLRLFKLAKQWKTMMDLLNKMSTSISDMGNLLLLLLLFIYVGGLIGMQFFANFFCFDSFGFRILLYDPEWNDGWVSRANYNTLPWALFNTLNIMTAENWNNIMYDGWRATESGYSFIYFMSVVLFGQFIAMDMFLAILLSNFTNSPDDSACSKQQVLPKESGVTDTEENSMQELEVVMRAILHDPSDAKQQEVKHSVFPLSAGRTLLLFGPRNPIRLTFALIVSHSAFDWGILFFIIISSVCLAMEAPLMNPHSSFQKNLQGLDTSLTVLFMIEMVMKVVSVGFVFEERAYLRSSWNFVDFLVVMFSFASLFPFGFRAKNMNLKSLRALRTLRAFRPLRLISRVPSLKRVVNTLFQALPGVGDVMAITLFFLLVFGIISVNLFKGTMRNCSLGALYTPGALYDPVSNKPNMYGVLLTSPSSWSSLSPTEKQWFGPNSIFNLSTSNSSCSEVWPVAPCCQSWPANPDKAPTSRQVCECWGGTWVVWWGYWTFDNIGEAMLSLYQISSTEGWVYLMLECIDQSGVDMQPVRDNSLGIMVVFVLYMVVVHYFAINLVVGVILENFQKEATDEDFLLLTEQQQIFVKTQKVVGSLKPFKRRKPPGDCLGNFFFNILHFPYFDVIIMGCILLNTIIMAMQHKTQSDGFTLFFLIMDYLFCGIFTLEAALKLTVYKWKYFTEGWNRFDFVIVVATDIGLVLELSTGISLGPLAQVVRSFRVGRIVRLINGAETLSMLFGTLISTMISMANIGAVWLLIVFIFAVMANQLYAKSALPTGYNAQLNYYYNFQTFTNSLVTLFSFSGGEYWDGFSLALGSRTPDCVPDPVFDPNMCGFTHSLYVNPQNGCVPLNGCGNISAIFFMCFFYFLVVIVLLNLFVGVIIDEFKKQKPIEHISKKEFRNFNEKWGLFDPDATFFMDFKDLFTFLTVTDPPWKIDRRISKKDFYLKTVSWKLKIYKGNKVHFYDVIHALAKDIMAQKLDKVDFHKRDHHFEDVVAKVLRVHRLDQIEPEVYKGIEVGLKENYKIQTVQAAWKEWKKQRALMELKQLSSKVSRSHSVSRRRSDVQEAQLNPVTNSVIFSNDELSDQNIKRGSPRFYEESSSF